MSLSRMFLLAVLQILIYGCDGIDSSSTATSDVDFECPEDFKQLTGDWCFHFRYDPSHAEAMNFTEAQDYCSEHDAILPAITSVEVTTALMLERTTVMGLSPFEVFYIGLVCDTTVHQWSWLDGPEFDPSVAHFQEHMTSHKFCTHAARSYVFDQFGTWTPAEIEYTASLVVCATRPTSYSHSPPIAQPCLDPWMKLPDGLCYRMSLLPKPLNMFDAELQCLAWGGHLPSITSNEQSDLINAFLSGKGHQNCVFWLGLHCSLDEDLDQWNTGKRAWVDRAPFSYSNFLDEEDDTDTCNIALVNTFVYSLSNKGKWMKLKGDETLSWLMCTRSDTQPSPPPTLSTVSTRRTTAAAVTSTTNVIITSTAPDGVPDVIVDESVMTSTESTTSESTANASTSTVSAATTNPTTATQRPTTSGSAIMNYFYLVAVVVQLVLRIA